MTSEPIDMSQVGLGKRYSSEDMETELRPGLKFAVKVVDTVESVRYSSGSPAIHRSLNRWQRMVHRMTPRRWRKSLLARPAELPSVTINGPESKTIGRTVAQIEQMKAAWHGLE